MNSMRMMDSKKVLIMVAGLLVGIIFGAICIPLGVYLRRNCGKKVEGTKDKYKIETPDPKVSNDED